jgi:hypothetical protein
MVSSVYEYRKGLANVSARFTAGFLDSRQGARAFVAFR